MYQPSFPTGEPIKGINEWSLSINNGVKWLIDKMVDLWHLLEEIPITNSVNLGELLIGFMALGVFIAVFWKFASIRLADMNGEKK